MVTSKLETRTSHKFIELVENISEIGRAWHTDTLLRNARQNSKFIRKTISDLDSPAGQKKLSALIISAGPSLHKYDVIRKIKEANYPGTIIAIDGSLIKCLKNGLI